MSKSLRFFLIRNIQKKKIKVLKRDYRNRDDTQDKFTFLYIFPKRKTFGENKKTKDGNGQGGGKEIRNFFLL